MPEDGGLMRMGLATSSECISPARSPARGSARFVILSWRRTVRRFNCGSKLGAANRYVPSLGPVTRASD